MEMKEKRNSEMSVGDTEDLFKRIGTEGRNTASEQMICDETFSHVSVSADGFRFILVCAVQRSCL